MMEESLKEFKGKEIQAHNPQGHVIYRFIGRKMYIKGTMKEQVYQVIEKFKLNKALKGFRQSRDWVEIDFSEDVLTEDIYEQFIPALVSAIKTTKQLVVEKDL